MGSIRSILLDIDGVLHVSMQPIAGSAEAVSWLERKGYKTYFVSNTTTMARKTLAQRLQSIGFSIPEQYLITAPVAAANYIRQHFPHQRCWLLTKGDTASDFDGIELLSTDDIRHGARADVVIIGGAEELLSYEAMNAAFRLLMAGAPLIAMHTNLYWRTQDGLQLDSGPFIHALEEASNKKAIVVGKPEPAFFAQAIELSGVAAAETVMVGDDIKNDIEGAQRVGMRGVLVCTGKHTMDSPLLAQVHPDAILPSLADLPHWLEHGRGIESNHH